MNFELLKKELELDEDRRMQAYKDSFGNWTIGVGHLIGADPGLPACPRIRLITEAECDAFLRMDIDAAIKIANGLMPSLSHWIYGDEPTYGPSNDPQCRVIVNMAFNLGNRLAGFKKFIAAVNDNDFHTAAMEMMDSAWAKQVPNRVARLVPQMIEGVADR